MGPSFYGLWGALLEDLGAVALGATTEVNATKTAALKAESRWSGSPCGLRSQKFRDSGNLNLDGGASREGETENLRGGGGGLAAEKT